MASIPDYLLTAVQLAPISQLAKGTPKNEYPSKYVLIYYNAELNLGSIGECRPKCPGGNMKKCPNFHPLGDCELWVRGQQCRSYKKYQRVYCGYEHRSELENKGFSNPARHPNFNPCLPRTQIVDEVEIKGKITVGLKWSIISDEFAAMKAVGNFAMGKSKTYTDLNLSAGVFSCSGTPLKKIYTDSNNGIIVEIVKLSVSTNKDNEEAERLNYKDKTIFHHGPDAEGGIENQSKPGNFGYNEIITIDFDRMPSDVGTIVFSVSAPDASTLPFLNNSSVSIFSTPNDPNATTSGTPLCTVKLDGREEFQMQPGYIFGKCVRNGVSWKFVPIRANVTQAKAEDIIQYSMSRYVMETKSDSIPNDPLRPLEISLFSLTRSSNLPVPIKKVGFVCFDVFGNPKNMEPFEIVYETNYVRLLFGCNCNDKILSGVFIYVEHGDEEIRGSNGETVDTFFVISKEKDIIFCSSGIVTDCGQLVARILNIQKSIWDVTSYNYPLNFKIEPQQFVLSKSLFPNARNEIVALRDWLCPNMEPSVVYQLALEVLYGENLAVKDLKTSDPFIVVKFGSQTHKTEVKKNTLAPTWNSKFLLNFEHLYSAPKLIFKCKDWNRITSSAFMGRVEMDLVKELNEKNYNQQIRLPLCTDTKHEKDEVSGNIVVKMYFCAAQK